MADFDVYGIEMNILTDDLPRSVEIGGVRFDINTDFRVWIKFALILENVSESTAKGELLKIMTMCFKIKKGNAKFIASWVDVMKAFGDFYRRGASVSAKGSDKRILSFEHDADLIYAAFMQAYGIDLTKSELHWWKFCALLASLPDETQLCRIMAVRATDLSEIKDRAAKARMRRLKRACALPNTMREDENQNEIAQALWQAQTV